MTRTCVVLSLFRNLPVRFPSKRKHVAIRISVAACAYRCIAHAIPSPEVFLLPGCADRRRLLAQCDRDPERAHAGERTATRVAGEPVEDVPPMSIGRFAVGKCWEDVQLPVERSAHL